MSLLLGQTCRLDVRSRRTFRLPGSTFSKYTIPSMAATPFLFPSVATPTPVARRTLHDKFTLALRSNQFPAVWTVPMARGLCRVSVHWIAAMQHDAVEYRIVRGLLLRFLGMVKTPLATQTITEEASACSPSTISLHRDSGNLF